MGFFTLETVERIALAAGDKRDDKRVTVGSKDQRARRTTVAEYMPWRVAGHVTDEGATCVGCGDFHPWAEIELGHILPIAVTRAMNNGRSPITSVLPECVVCNRIHGEAEMPFVPRYNWGVAIGTRVGLAKNVTSEGYKYQGSRGYKATREEKARKVSQWSAR